MSKTESTTPETQPPELIDGFASHQNSESVADAGILLKEELLSVISHELRNPLTAIIGWTQVLLEGKADAVMTRRALETINRNAKAQIQMIENLQDVSRLMTGKLRLEPRPVALPELLNSTIETARPAAAAKRLTIETDFDDITTPIDVDAARLMQVLTQLLSNAVKFTPSDGRIDVRLRRVEPFIEIAVADTGIGVKSEDLPEIFERMMQINASAKHKYGGLGVGLTIVRKLIELHGGSVKADSPGENLGATFTIQLPAKSTLYSGEFVAAATKKLSLNQVERLDGWKLLIVDDDQDNLELLMTLFTKFGATVETADSVAAGFEKFQSFAPDLLISDIGMPDEDGYSLIRKIRNLKDFAAAKNPAIALTAFTKPEDVARAHAAGFQRHIKKPISPAELIKTATETLRSAKND